MINFFKDLTEKGRSYLAKIASTLLGKDMNPQTKVSQGNKYIPWAAQWGEFLKSYPLAVYEVHENEVGDPFTVSTLGIMVKVSVNVEGLVRTINYPVMNGANKAMKIDAYSYQVMEYRNGKPTGKMLDRHVAAATTFDVNTSIFRALTKCIALFGQGLHVYRDELHPEVQYIESEEIQDILNRIKAKGMKLSEVTRDWRIDKIAHLPASRYDDFIEWLG